MDGRKLAGGKLEVKVRVRDPFKGRHVEETNVKWLVIDQFLHSVDSKVSEMLMFDIVVRIMILHNANSGGDGSGDSDGGVFACMNMCVCVCVIVF